MAHKRIRLRSIRGAIRVAAGSKIKIRTPNSLKKGEGNALMRLMIIIRASVQRLAQLTIEAIPRLLVWPTL